MKTSQKQHFPSSLLNTNEPFDVVIVGAGAAGIGCAIILQELGIHHLCLLERDRIGASFLHWPEEMRFITPSFPSNQFGLLDLNAVGLNTSPAYSLQKEHPSGPEYARYLQGLVEYYTLPVTSGIAVTDIRSSTNEGGLLLQTSSGEIATRFVIWAAGEFFYPRVQGIAGAEYCLHTSQVRSWKHLAGESFLVIGGYESGIDAAVHLIAQGKTVAVLDRSATWERNESDPSMALSPYTQQRLQEAQASGRLHLLGEKQVQRVSRLQEGYLVESADGERYLSPTTPLLATGFGGSLQLIRDQFAWDENNRAVLTLEDESTMVSGLFVVGSQLIQNELLFCFIYKFRQRFAVVVNAIAQRLGVDTTPLERYREQNMFLDDLTCCGEECAC
jgi:putative flavoprotein involved in K+ transport